MFSILERNKDKAGGVKIGTSLGRRSHMLEHEAKPTKEQDTPLAQPDVDAEDTPVIRWEDEGGAMTSSLTDEEKDTLSPNKDH